ncbi:MAG: winged helix-turn-helix domain-containing protein [Promethearchaeota archaeon]
MHRWNEKGPAGLVDIPQSGRPPFLTDEEQAELVQDVVKSPRESGFDYSNWMLKLIVEHVKRKYGVKMTLSGVWRLLKRHKMTRLVPRPLPAKADPQKKKNSSG